MNQLRINIAEPCHEDWDKMENRSTGRHCNSCEKTVVDFTGQDRQQIESYIVSHSDQKICGRFRSGDIQTAAIVPAPPVKVGWFRSRWLAFVAAVSFLGLGKRSEACPPPVNDHHPEGNETKGLKAKQGQTVVHGCVRNSEDKKGIARAEVRIYSGGNEIAYSKSFVNGSYFITIPENTIWDYKITLEYNAIDFQSQILRDIPVSKDRITLDVAMLAVQELVADRGVIMTADVVMGALEMDHIMIEQREEPLMGAVRYEMISVFKEMVPMDSIPKVLTEDTTETVAPKADLNVKTYPNPSTGIFTVELDYSENITLMVYDLQGSMVLNKKVSSSKETIDLTDRPNGTYIVLAIDEQTGIKKQNKVIKMQ